jgi:hypothetical protein
MCKPIPANDGARPSGQAGGRTLRAAHAKPRSSPQADVPVRVAA